MSDTSTEKEELQAVARLETLDLAMRRLLSTMDNNLFLLEDSVREVRTARQIAAESNRTARRRALREGSSALLAATK